MVKWYKDGKEITASKKFTMEDKGKLHKLVASAVTKEDEGIYTCKIGDDTLIFDLKVSGKFVMQVWHQSMLETQDLVHYTCLLPFFLAKNVQYYCRDSDLYCDCYANLPYGQII